MEAGHAPLDRFWRGAFLLAVALLPFPGLLPAPWPGTAMRASDLPLALALVAYAIQRVSKREWRLSPWQWAAGAYCGWAVLSWLAHGASREGSVKLLGLASLIGTATLAAALPAREVVVRVVAIGVCLSALLSLAGQVAFVQGWSTPLVGGTGDLLAGDWARSQAGFSHPNLAGSFAVFAFAASLQSAAPLGRVASIAATVVAVTAFSRATLSLLAIPWLAAGGRRARAAAIVVATLLAALTLARFSLDPTRPWALNPSKGPLPREQALRTALDSVRRSPLLGVGPGALPAHVFEGPFHAHCTPLNVAGTLGLPGLAFFGLAVALALRAGESRAARIPLVALLLDGVAIDVEDFRHFWLALGLAASRAAMADDQVRIGMRPTPTRR